MAQHHDQFFVVGLCFTPHRIFGVRSIAGLCRMGPRSAPIPRVVGSELEKALHVHLHSADAAGLVCPGPLEGHVGERHPSVAGIGCVRPYFVRDIQKIVAVESLSFTFDSEPKRKPSAGPVAEDQACPGAWVKCADKHQLLSATLFGDE